MKRFAYLVLGCSLLIGGACGDDDGREPAPDAGTEDPDPTVSPGTCGLVVGSDTAGFGLMGDIEDLSGVPVMFNAPDGALLGVDFTDVKGEASFSQCVENTTISFVINVNDNYRSIFSYAGAMPGDTFYYRAQRPYSLDPGPTYVQVNVSHDMMPPALPGGGDYYYETDIGCDADEGSFQHDEMVPNEYFPGNYLSDTEGIAWECLGDQTGDVDVLAWLNGDPFGPGENPFNDGNDTRYYYSMARANVSMGNFEDGPTLNPVQLGPWMGPHINNTHTIHNGPSRSAWASIRTHHYVDGQEWIDAVDSTSFDDGTDERMPPVYGDDFRGLPEGFGENTVSYSSIQVVDADIFEQHLQNEVFGPFMTDPAHEYSDHLPMIRDVILTDIQSGRPVLRWYSDGAGDAEMGAFRAYMWSSFSGDIIAWHLLTNRPEAGSFAAPEMPADIAALLAWPDLEGGADVGSYNHFDWTSFSGLLGTMGFDPNYLTESRDDDFVRYLPGRDMSMGGRMRRSQWSTDLE